MNVKQIFDLGTKVGIAADPRGPAGIKKHLARIKKEYEGMKPSEQKFFDTDRLTNPFLDSGIHHDNGTTTVKRVLAGIDINAAEILLASQLSERGKKIDLVIAHHPEGKALAYLHEVMGMQIDIYTNLGVPVHIAEKIMEERVREVGRGLHPVNHNQAVDIARLLNINFINTHTITDNIVNSFMLKHLAKTKPETIGDLLHGLYEIPEYQEARKFGAEPRIIAGSPNHKVGKVLVEMTGGTTPSSKVYQELSRFGISTIVGMHMKEDSMKQANEFHMNVVMAGHMSSDSLGMNLFLDELEKRGIEIVPCGGLIRVSRNKSRK